MKLIHQVCTFEQAEQLKALGVRQQSIFYWNNYTGKMAITFRADQPYTKLWPDVFSAYTSSELGLMLPRFFTTSRTQAGNLQTKEEYPDPFVCLLPDDKHVYGISMMPTEAIAKADMVIYLINEGHLSVTEINSRLEAAEA